MSKAPKKKESKDRVPSAQLLSANATGEGSVGDPKSAKRKPPVTLWPEWSDADIANEKWDTGKKPNERGKSPNSASICFDDPDGRVDLPESLKQVTVTWKRPHDIFLEKDDGSHKPVSVVDTDYMHEESCDLLTPNEHIAHSEFIRWFISSISSLWQYLPPDAPDSVASNLKVKPSGRDTKDIKKDLNKKDVEEEVLPWKPWQLIWPKDNLKQPIHNAGGKYAVKVFWMGCWRKIIVDDSIPCNESGVPLLPMTIHGCELWPLILSKALIKIASLDYQGGCKISELGEVNLIHHLTGWLPEPISLQSLGGGEEKLWQSFKKLLPLWDISKIVADKKAKQEEAMNNEADLVSGKEAEAEPEPPASLVNSLKVDDGKKKDKDGSGKPKGKEKEADKKDKIGKDKGKDDGNSARQKTCDTEKRRSDLHYAMFVSYRNPPKQPCTMTEMRKMADASEKLRQAGLSHNLPHLVKVTQMRDMPLVAPPEVAPIPRWRLIRQKKRPSPVDSAPPIPVEREHKYLELESPFFNFKVSQLPISRVGSPQKFPKFNPATDTMDTMNETPREDIPDSDGVEEFSLEKGQVDALTTEALKAHEKQTALEAAPNLSPGPGPPSTINSQLSPVPPKSPKSGRKSEKSAKTDATVVEKGKDARTGSQQSQGSAKKEVAKDKKEKKKSATVTAGKEEVKQKEETKVLDRRGSAGIKKSAKSKKDKETESEVPETEVGESESPVEKAETDIDGQSVQPDGEGVDGEKPPVEEIPSRENKPQWFHYEDFTQCFTTVWVFHKPSALPVSKILTEMKQPSDGSSSKDKSNKKNGTAPAPPSSAAGRKLSSPVIYASHNPLLDSPPPFLFVDSADVSSLVITLSVLPRWFNPNIHFHAAGREDGKKMIEDSFIPNAGSLIIEPYTWKNVITGQPILTISTTCVKSATLKLPPGRHVLRFMIQSPLGYHINVSSKQDFVLGDEDSVMPHLRNESERFIMHSQNTLSSLGSVIESFSGDRNKHRDQDFLIGSEKEDNLVREEHYESMFMALRLVLQHELGEKFLPTMIFALNALKYECYLRMKPFKNAPTIQDESLIQMDQLMKPESTVLIPEHKSQSSLVSRSSLPLPSTNPAEKSSEETSEEIGIERIEDAELAEEEMVIAEDEAEKHAHATKIQAVFRGHYTNSLVQAHKVGTKENSLVVELLTTIWNHMDQHMDTIAIKFYRTMFDLKPSLLNVFPFHTDEWNKIAYADYAGSYHEQNSYSWFVIAREIFYVKESTLLLPKLYANIPSCNLRVINNDTKEELKRVFMKIAPQVLHRNKNGYTFVAEGRSTTSSVPSGKFRVRLIGEKEPLPAPKKEGQVNNSFALREIQDYYIPDRNNVLFRYTVKTAEDILTSIQLNTSKQDVYLKVRILDGEEEIASAEGRGHVVLPVVFFRKDRTLESIEEEERARSRSLSRASSGGRSTTKAGTTTQSSKHQNSAKRSASPKKEDRRKSIVNHNATSIESVAPRAAEEDVPETTVPLVVETHKYIIQAFVLRNSWPLTAKQWDHVDELKRLEKEKEKEQIDADGNPDLSSSKDGKESKGSAKGKKDGKKEGKARPGSRSESAALVDDTKPNWTMRVVLDSTVDQDVEIKRDTTRQDEIKAMKFAWEAAEPGRAEKARAARQKFLDEHSIKVETPWCEVSEELEDGEMKDEPSVVDDASETGRSSVRSQAISEEDSGELYHERPMKESSGGLQPFDITPYIRSTGKPAVYLDQLIEDSMEATREEKFLQFSKARAQVLKQREDDRIRRNQQKVTQLQEYEDMQIRFDTKIAELYAKREAYRQKFIEKPAEAEPEVDPKKKRSPSPKKSGSKAGKKGKK